ncbi:MAG: NAD-dependent epimerase/dehydratase family protein [Planctomycetota bacterium]
MTALVTGGGGFLGGAIVRALVEGGAPARSFSRGEHPWLRELGVAAVRGDIAESEEVLRACEGCDVVYHVAALAGIWGSRRLYERTNVEGTRNVIAACREHGIRRLVYTSSPSVVFEGRDQEGVDESLPYPRRHLADYPRTKAEAERMVLAANDHELATIALRPHLIWGPGDPHLVPRLVARARAGRLRLIGGRDPLVDSTFIDNAAAAHLLAATRLEAGSPVAGNAYFITNGEPLPLSGLVNGILEAAGAPPVERRIPTGLAYMTGATLEGVYRLLGLPGEPPMTRFLARQLSTAHWFDISAARRDLGYEPRVSIEEGLRGLRAWFEGKRGTRNVKREGARAG